MPSTGNRRFLNRLGLAAMALCLTLTPFAGAGFALAQVPDGVNVPGFWDPNRRFPKPDRTKVRAIRFLTEQESPPFSFTAPDGLPAGFNVDLARAVCEELDIPCTIQELKWDLLIDAIADDRGDAIIAPIPVTAENREKYEFTNSFLGRPGRFVGTRSTLVKEITAEGLAERKIGIVAGTRHADFIATYRGRRLPDHPPIDPSQIQSFGFLIADKQEGPFELEIDWIGVRDYDGESGERLEGR